MKQKTFGMALLFAVTVSAWAQGSGDVLFASKCSSCHGTNGAGKTAFAQKARIPDLGSPEVQSLSDKQLFESIARGTGHKEYPHSFLMRGLSVGDVDLLVKKVREFKK